MNSPGKVKRIFIKKRTAFEKVNPPLPTETVTKLNKLRDDFSELQKIANKAKGQARAAEANRFDAIKDRMADNLTKVAKQLWPGRTKLTVKPFYDAIKRTRIFVDQFNLQTIDNVELETKDDEAAFDNIAVEEQDESETSEQSDTPPVSPRRPVNPPPLPPQGNPSVTTTTTNPNAPPRPLSNPPPVQQNPSTTTNDAPPRRPSNPPNVVGNPPPPNPGPQISAPPTTAPPPLPDYVRRQGKGQVIATQRTKATEALTALNSLEGFKDFSKAWVKELEEKAKKGVFGQDKEMAKLAASVSAYIKLKDKPGADPRAVKDARTEIETRATSYKVWADQNFANDIASGQGNKFDRYQLATGALKKIKGLDDAETKMATNVTELSMEVLKALNDSTHFIAQGTSTGPTANGTSVQLLRDLVKHPALPPTLKPSVQAVIDKAGPILQAEAQQRLAALNNPSLLDRVSIQMEFGGCKVPPPDEKGTSDLFVICETDGKPSHFFKPSDGEQRAGADWPDGCGATHEVLLSKLSDQLSQSVGLDCRVPKTELLQITDESFKNGQISQNPKRTGALVKAVQFQQGDPRNALDWLQNSGNPRQEMAKLNKQDCQNVLLMNFITLDLDANAGNILVTNANAGPGQARVTPIDAGRKLPSPGGFKRGCGSMSTRKPPDPDTFVSDDSFLLQTPAATEPFGNDVIGKIRQLDADQIVRQMRADYNAAKQQAPELDNTVEDGSFEMLGKSVRFLKLAVEQNPPLTPFDISEIYAKGFTAIIDATTPQQETQAIQNVIADLQTVKANGGDAAVEALFPKSTMSASSLTLRQKAHILTANPAMSKKEDFERYHYQELQGELHDIQNYIPDGPERITDELTKPYSKENYKHLTDLNDYKRWGGDQMFKKLIDCDPSYQVEVAKPLRTRASWPAKTAGYYYGKGSTPAFVRLIGQNKFDADFRGKPIDDLNNGLDAALAAAKG